MSDTRMASWINHDAQDNEIRIAVYADIGVGPAVVADAITFTDPAALRAWIKSLSAAADWLEEERTA